MTKTTEKSVIQADKYIDEGNAFLKTKQLHKALVMYNSAVRYSTTTQCARAYGNRSAVLFMLTQYDACIRDIQRAVSVRSFLSPRYIECFHVPDATPNQIDKLEERCQRAYREIGGPYVIALRQNDDKDYFNDDMFQVTIC
jgi:hypothetical protein